MFREFERSFPAEWRDFKVQIVSLARGGGTEKDIEAKSGRRYNLPVFYFTQLLGLAMGCRADELSLGSLVVEPKALLEAKGIGR